MYSGKPINAKVVQITATKGSLNELTNMYYGKVYCDSIVDFSVYNHY